MNLIYVHIGSSLPRYLSDNVFQTLYLSKKYSKKINIFIVLSDILIPSLQNQVSLFSDIHINHALIKTITYVKESELRKENDNISVYMEHLNKDYRDNFWNSTTTRFFYITKCIEKYLSKAKNIIHIESDVLLYDLLFIDKLEPLKDKEIYMVKDHEYRVVPSILIYKNLDSAIELSKHIMDFLFKDIKDVVFANDMHILANYKYIKKLPYDILDTNTSVTGIIFDGASIGQYLCGVDPRNIKIDDDEPFYKNLNLKNKDLVKELMIYDNPKVGFVNETFKIMSTNKIIRYNDHYRLLTIENYNKNNEENNCFGNRNSKNKKTNLENNSYKIINLHIHSKQLWSVNSINNLRYKDIISGDRILENCDIVFTTPSIIDFHKELGDYKSISIQLPLKFEIGHKIQIESAIKEVSDTLISKNEKRPLRIFIYSHYLDTFTELLKRLNIDHLYDIVLYIHNSDNEYISPTTFYSLHDMKNIKRIYCQNLRINEIYNNKFNVIPIGQANRMWNHGSTISLYKAIENSYKNRRSNGIYINVSETHSLRKKILNKIDDHNAIETNTGSGGSSGRFEISKNKDYETYLSEISTHYFALCPRGNGIDTHRFWESLYLGVIPVIVIDESDGDYNDHNKFNTDNKHYCLLKNNGIPFYEVSLKDLSPELFTKEKYISFIEIYGPIQCLDGLKISNYL